MITTLINNAAINPNVDRDGLSSLGRLSDFSADVFQREVSVGLTGAINCGVYLEKKWIEMVVEIF